MAPGLFDAFNGEEDEETALQRALALSREELTPQMGSKKDITQIVSDDEDDVVIVPSPAKQQSSVSSVLGVDRRQMEAELLARLKRKQPPSAAVSDQRPSQKPRSSGVSTIASKEEAATSISGTAGHGRLAGGLPTIQNPLAESKAAATSSQRFPYGVVKRTWVRGQPRQEDDIKIEEVLLKDELIFAMLSSFQWEEEWMLSKINLQKTPILLVAFAVDEEQRAEMRANAPSNRVRFCFPPMYGPMCNMHSKLMILNYTDYLRVVVPTGNLVPYDWGESGTMENMVFLIDLPRLPAPAPKGSQDMPFAVELARFLKAQGHGDELVDSLNKYDFSRTAPYGFIHSIAGSHINHNWNTTGYTGLGRIVTALGLGTEADIEIDAVTSSIGSLNDAFIRTIYYACQGDSGVKEFDTRRSAKAKKDKVGHPEVANLRPRFRIYFPSRKTVEQSRGGVDGAGTLFLQSKWWNQPTFPRDTLRECRSTRPGLLMHNKVLFVTGKSTTPWAYVGSANLSESAWGHLSKDRTTGQFKATCRNWECGVLVPGKPPQVGTPSRDSISLHDVFKRVVPVPMEHPAKSFVANPEIGPPFLAGSGS